MLLNITFWNDCLFIWRYCAKLTNYLIVSLNAFNYFFVYI